MVRRFRVLGVELLIFQMMSPGTIIDQPKKSRWTTLRVRSAWWLARRS